MTAQSGVARSLTARPMVIWIVAVTVSLHGRWAILPAMAGVCASLFLSGLGLSSLASVVSPYAVSRPGDSPFQQPQRTGGGLSQGVVLVGAVALKGRPVNAITSSARTTLRPLLARMSAAAAGSCSANSR